MKSHSVLGLDFSAGVRPRMPAQTVTDIDGHTKTLVEVRAALEDQLRERLSLVEAPDAVVANLLFDLGNLLMLEHTPDLAYRVYQVADRYALNVPLIHQRLAASRPASILSFGETLPLVLVWCLGLGIVGAIGWYLRQFARRSRQPAV
ncbi:MAG TPA: hypothetical protein VGG30_03160 [Pirellulales bacterium]